MRATPQKDVHLLVSSGKKYKSVWSSEVQYICLNKGCTVLCRYDGKRFVTSKNMKELMDVLPSEQFIMISRSVAINLYYVDTVENGSVNVVEMMDGEEFQISRRKRTSFYANMVKV